MYRIFFSMILLLSYVALKAQLTAINLRVFEGGTILKDEFKVKIHLNNRYYDLIYRDTILLIPDSLYGMNIDLEIVSSKYKLSFENLYISWNKEFLYWIINIDFPPFDKNKNWDIKKKLKKIKWIFSIDRGNGTIIKYYGRKPINNVNNGLKK